MRPASLAAMALASLAVGQSPLTTMFTGGETGFTDGGVFFDLTVNTTVTFTRIDLNAAWFTTSGSFDVFLGPSTWAGNVNNQALWTSVAHVPATSSQANQHTVGVLPSPFALRPGHYGVAIQAHNFSHLYTVGNGSNQHFATAELSLDAGAAQHIFLSPTFPPFTQRVVNAEFTYTLGGTPIAVAGWNSYGTGCYGFYTSFYEFWASSGTMDLGTASGTNALHLALSGNSYVASVNRTGNAAWFAPTSTALVIGEEDSITQAVPFPVVYPSNSGPQISTSFSICSNGYVSPGLPNSISPFPFPPDFLSGHARWGNWRDFDPTAATPGNGVFFDVDPSATTFYVTWLNVPDYSIPNTSSTWQIAFSNNGDVEFRWRSMSQRGGVLYQTLIGWTPGEGALDPGNRDLSASPTFATQAGDHRPLAVAMSARPLLGTTPNMVTSNIPAGTSLGVRLLSFTQYDPGLPLDSLGMPGCFQYCGLDASLMYVASSSQVTAPFPIPNASSLTAMQMFGQWAMFSSGFNPLGVITSNGLRLLTGSQ